MGETTNPILVPMWFAEFAEVQIYRRGLFAMEVSPLDPTWRFPGTEVSRPPDAPHIKKEASAFISLCPWFTTWHEMQRQDTLDSDNVYLSDVVFDFDNLVVAQAQEDARNFVRMLMEAHSVVPRIYFSGCKGFHIVVPLDAFAHAPLVDNARGIPFVRVPINTVKQFAKELAGGISSFDVSIYKRRSLIRMENTWHPAGQAFKVRLSYRELINLDINVIRELAQSHRTENDVAFDDVSFSPSLAFIWNKHHMAEIVANDQRMSPSAYRPINYSLDALFAPAPKGQRNVRATALGGLLVKKFDDYALLLKILQIWNDRNVEPLGDLELQTVAKSVYRNYNLKHHKF